MSSGLGTPLISSRCGFKWLEYCGFRVLYDPSKRVPRLVLERLIPHQRQKRGGRRGTFREDPRLPDGQCASAADYTGTGWTRGHMARASNHSYCTHAWEDSFTYTQVCPQNAALNCGAWRRLETYVWKKAQTCEETLVASGPLFLKRNVEQRTQSVYQQVIGEQGVWVPSDFFKYVRYADGSEDAFITPNRQLGAGADIQKFRADRQEIECLSGFRFDTLPLESLKQSCRRAGACPRLTQLTTASKQ